MNFFNNPIPNNNIPNQINNPIIQNDLFFQINELLNKIKILEQRIIRLESEKNNQNYIEPDTSLYML